MTDKGLVQLKDVKKGSRVDISHLNLMYNDDSVIIKEVTFYHLDGMYSLCKTDKNRLLHLRFDTPVKVIL